MFFFFFQIFKVLYLSLTCNVQNVRYRRLEDTAHLCAARLPSASLCSRPSAPPPSLKRWPGEERYKYKGTCAWLFWHSNIFISFSLLTNSTFFRWSSRFWPESSLDRSAVFSPEGKNSADPSAENESCNNSWIPSLLLTTRTGI